ncbi:MAG TPA: hypothetical protein DHW82_04830 [Spirochaetia bacterium]|nr:MAG: hypothetical protein A2Y41_12620 [Spirochaetes bacterium GWB1_36_13]HCL56317.1 hypothetical protein [Spirochaetia bacterium]
MSRLFVLSVSLLFFILFGSIGLKSIFSEEAKANACDVTVYLNDPDKSGTNVRDKPKGKVVKQLPKQDDSNFETGIYLHIKASKDNWLQIEEVYDTNDSSYKNTWISGKLAATGTANYDPSVALNIYEKPSTNSKFIQKVYEEIQITVLGCSGKWVYGTGKAGGKIITGWIEPEKQCSSAVTNCN